MSSRAIKPTLRIVPILALMVFLGCIILGEPRPETNDDIDPENCTHKEYKLYGKIEIV